MKVKTLGPGVGPRAQDIMIKSGQTGSIVDLKYQQKFIFVKERVTWLFLQILLVYEFVGIQNLQNPSN